MPRPIPFQQVTVEYVVQGSLDGLTPAPPVSFDPSSDDYVAPDERGIRVVQVEGDLGIIDPDFNSGGAQGDRCIPWVYLDTGGVGGAIDSSFVVLDVQEEDGISAPIPQVHRFSTGGLSVFYAEKGTHIPQGSALGIDGYTGYGPKIVRLNVVAPSTALEEAKIKEACCCTNRPCGPIPGSPSFISELSAHFFPLDGESTVQVEGFGLFATRPTDDADPTGGIWPWDFAWVGVNNDGYLPTTVTNFRPLLDGTTLTEVTFVPNEGMIPGLYQLIGFDPFDPDCNTADQGDPLPIASFDENPPVCPEISTIDGAIGFGIPTGATGLPIDLTGLNLGTTDGGPDFTAALLPSFPPGNDPLVITDVSITADDVAATITYNTTGQEGAWTLVLTPTDLSCPPITFEDILFVIGV